MKVADNNLWGSNIDEVLKYGKFYSLYSRVIYLIDIILMIIVVSVMFNNHVTFGVYVQAMLIVGVICIFALNIPLKEDLWNTYLFYKTFKKHEVKVVALKLESNDAYSCLYKCNRSRLKKNDDLESYLDLMNMTCKKNRKFSSRLMKNLMQFKCSEDESNLSVKYIEKGNKVYYIDFDLCHSGESAKEVSLSSDIDDK